MSVAAPRRPSRAPFRQDTPPDWDRVREWSLAHLVELVEETGVTVRRGRCACPLHGGDNPEAFSVSVKGWKCFTGSCGGGDGVGFVAKLRYSHLPDGEARIAALRELAPRAGVVLEARPEARPLGGAKAPPRRPAASPKALPRKAPPKAVQPLPAEADAPDPCAPLREMGLIPAPRPFVHQVVREALTLGAEGRTYLRDRGFDPDAAEAYGFRSIPTRKAWELLEEALREEFLPEELERAGIKHLPMGRAPALLIPYHTPEGAPWTFRLRSLTADAGWRYATLQGDAIPYPFNAQALAGLTRDHELHIVEGEINAYALQAHGLRAVGLDGAGKWRPEWTAGLRDAARVVAWYDDDDAGTDGWRKLTQTLAAGIGRRWTDDRVRRVKITKQDGRKDAADLHRRGELAPLLEEAAWRTA